jgi:hypothetical protein
MKADGPSQIKNEINGWSIVWGWMDGRDSEVPSEILHCFFLPIAVAIVGKGFSSATEEEEEEEEEEERGEED